MPKRELSMQRATVSLALVTALGACAPVTNLPPVQTPEKTLPALEISGVPAAGLGRVVLDVDGERAYVDQVNSGSMSASGMGSVFNGSVAVSQRVCVTPCVVDLAPGPHTLRFSSTIDSDLVGDGFVNIDTSLNAYRYKFGTNHEHTGRRIGAWIAGFFGVSAGIALIDTSVRGESSGMIGAAVVGIPLTLLSLWLFQNSDSVHQEGAGVQWAVPGH